MKCILINLDPTKQVIEMYFSHNVFLIFDDSKIQFASPQKHLRLIYHSKLDFNQLTYGKTNICHKSIEIMKTFSIILSREILSIFNI